MQGDTRSSLHLPTKPRRSNGVDSAVTTAMSRRKSMWMRCRRHGGGAHVSGVNNHMGSQTHGGTLALLLMSLP